jgi:hypothetical protein
MAVDGGELVDPLTTDMHGEEVAITERNVIAKMTGIASHMTSLLLNRSHVPDGMPVDDPVPIPVKRKIHDTAAPEEGGYGPIRLRQIAPALGLDGEKVRALWGSVASASSSAAAAAGSASSSAAATAGGYIASGASQYGQFVQEKGIDNLIWNFGVVGRGAVNMAAGTASAAASGTGAILNFAGGLIPPTMTQEQYRLEQLREAQEDKERVYMNSMARMHEKALIVQEELRYKEENENRRKAEEAMAKARAQEEEFQDARSAASMVVRQKHGNGRAANVAASLQATQVQGRARQQVREAGVRNEEAVEGFGRKLARGISSFMAR